MKTKSKTAKIKELLSLGREVKDIAKQIKVPAATVYTVRWKMKQENKTEKDVSKVPTQPAKKPIPFIEIPVVDFVRDELITLQEQIYKLKAIETFLTLRLRQLEQNND